MSRGGNVLDSSKTDIYISKWGGSGNNFLFIIFCVHLRELISRQKSPDQIKLKMACHGVFCKLYHSLMFFHCMTPTRLTARGVIQ